MRRAYQALGYKLYLNASDLTEEILKVGDEHGNELLKIADMAVYSQGSHSDSDQAILLKNSLVSKQGDLDSFSTGYPTLDRYIQGLKLGDLTVLAAVQAWAKQP